MTNWYDVIVRDAAGFTFGFSYKGKSAADVRAQFWANLKRLGKKKRHIKILEVMKV